MVSKQSLSGKAFGRAFLAALMLALSAACTQGPGKGDEYIIGEKLKDISPLTSAEGQERGHVAIFDKTVRAIQQFDLVGKKHERTLDVVNPELEHYLLYYEGGNYVVDLTTKHLTIFNSQGVPQHDPIRLIGKPQSAAFRPNKGLLVVYDELGSVGLLKLSSSGNVLAKWVGGSLLSSTIVSGDINDNGQLVLALSNNTITVVDIEQSIAQGSWSYSAPFTVPGLTRMSWVAPLRGNPNQVLVRAREKVALIDLTARAIIGAPYEMPSEGSVVKLSKGVDPHVIFRDGRATTAVYAEASTVKTRSIYGDFPNILDSRLSLAEDYWSILEAAEMKQTYVYSTGQTVQSPEKRSLRRFRFSDQLATYDKLFPDGVQLELTATSVFALYQHKLGYAENFDIGTEAKTVFKLFNKDRIK